MFVGTFTFLLMSPIHLRCPVMCIFCVHILLAFWIFTPQHYIKSTKYYMLICSRGKSAGIIRKGRWWCHFWKKKNNITLWWCRCKGREFFGWKKKSRLKNLMGTLIPKYGAVLLLSLSGLLDLLPLYSFTSPIKNILLLSFFK